MKDKETGKSFGVPCGKCSNCVKRRASQWSFRLMQQEKVSTSAHFITLTYDTSTVPLTPKGFMSLDFRDTQLFLKRLRKAHPPGHRIKFYLVGEYGGRTMRPHYHALLFNVDIKLIQNAWQKGQIHYGKVTCASIGYSLKYMSKQTKIPLHQNDDRVKESVRMSKGIGLNYLSSAMIQWHKADPLRMYCCLRDGKKIAMPRYYKVRLYSQAELNTYGELLAQMRLTELGEMLKKGGPLFFRNKVESDKAQDRLLLLNQSKGQTL